MSVGSGGPETEGRRHRSALRITGLVAALLMVIGFGWWQTRADEASTKFCTADGLIDADGNVYGRDPDQDCAFVDDDGIPISVDADGQVVPVPPR